MHSHPPTPSRGSEIIKDLILKMGNRITLRVLGLWGALLPYTPSTLRLSLRVC